MAYRVPTVLIAAAIALMPINAEAAGKGMRKDHHGGHGQACPMKALPKPHLSMKAMRALDLSPDQVERIAAIQEDFQSAKATTKTKVLPLKYRIFQELDADRPDAEKVRELFAQVFEHKRAMVGRRIDAANRIRDVLNDAQRRRYREMQEPVDRKGHHGGGGAQGHGQGHGW